MYIWQYRYFTCQLFVLFELFTITLSTVIIRLNKYHDNRILGGDYTTIENHPYAVQVAHNRVAVCGGSILTETIILTAAHCVIVDVEYSVRVGTTYRDSGGWVFQVNEIIIHKEFDRSRTTKFDFDVALLKIVAPLVYSDKVQPIGLATEYDRIIANNLGIALGWGKSKLNENILQQVALPVLTQSHCINAYMDTPLHSLFHNVTDRMFCASYLDTQGRDTCQGDSGGPFAVNGKLYGITSWGDACAMQRFPGVYVRLTQHNITTWINTNVFSNQYLLIGGKFK